MTSYKIYGEQILWDAVNNFNFTQLKKIANAAKYNQKTAIMATINSYCNKELERIQRLAKPKDIGDPTAIIFDAGKDLRSTKEKKYKRTIWEYMNGQEKER